ncbi:MAG: hypothetical protein F6J92_16495 [Symploca sp. SIO1A3]|nr:hypothetical protein [Symploca sp. SIO1A3]
MTIQVLNKLIFCSKLSEDEELLKLLIEYLAQPQQGKLEPFAPVVINILHSWLQQSNLQGDI